MARKVSINSVAKDVAESTGLKPAEAKKIVLATVKALEAHDPASVVKLVETAPKGATGKLSSATIAKSLREQGTLPQTVKQKMAKGIVEGVIDQMAAEAPSTVLTMVRG